MTNKYFLLSAVFFSVFSYAQEQLLQYDSGVFFKEGQELFAQSQYLKSADAYNQVHALDSNYPESQYERILSLIYADKREEALLVCQQTYEAKLYLEYPLLLVIHSAILSDNKNYDEALSILNEGEQFFKNSANFNYNKAIIYIRQEKKQQAVELLKANIKMDPIHELSLHSLGVLALEDGQIVEGSLLLMTQLLFNFNSSNAGAALQALNKDYSRSYVAQPQLKIREGNDDFTLLEEVLRNKFPYNNKFPLLTKFDDYAPRNIQAITEYFKDHKNEGGYFESKFGLLYKYIADRNLTKQYLITTMTTSRNLFESEFSKNEKDALAFQQHHIREYLWTKMYNTAILNGELYHENIYDSNSKYYFQMNGKEVTGKYFVYEKSGLPITSGYLKNELLDGTKTTYRKNGEIQTEENYVNSKKNGVSTDYFYNNKINFQANFVDGSFDGAYKLNYITELVNCAGNYKQNQYDGEILCYYPNGTLKLLVNYKNGKLHGEYKKFNEIGEVVEKANYIEDEVDGDYTTYYSTDKIKSINSIKNKIPQSYVSYYIEGNTDQETIYKNGKVALIKQYYIDGAQKSLKTYNEKEELINFKYYNSDGVLYYEESFNKGKAKQAIQYFADGSSEKTKSNGFSQLKTLDGVVISEGNLKNGLQDGEWKYYYPNQVLQFTTQYKEGIESGTRTSYIHNGYLDYIAVIENDKLNGYYNSYYNNKIASTSFYKEDKLNGPFSFYYPNGVLQNERFYADGSVYGWRKIYNQDASLYKTTKYHDDQLINVNYHYDNKIATVNYDKQDGVVEILSNNVIKRKISIKGGIDDGPNEIRTTTNENILKENSINGKLHGKALYYNDLGEKLSEQNYYLGNLHGEQIDYDLNGKIFNRANYEHGYLVGTEHFFFPNGKEINTVTYKNNIKNGVEYYYNSSGEKILAFHNKHNALISYQVLNTEGNLGELIPFTTKTLEITSKYTNGNPAITVNYSNGLQHGAFVIYDTENSKEFEKNYDKGVLDGTTTYYLNHKKYRTFQHSHGYKSGTSLYFDESENIKYSIDYVNDEKHGYFKTYKNNNVVKTKRYDSDILVEIQ